MLKKLILSPYINILIFLFQFIVWLVFMPNSKENVISQYKNSFKYLEISPFVLLIIFISIFFVSIFLGTKIKIKTNKINYKYLDKFNSVIFLLWLIAEYKSAKIFLTKPIYSINLMLSGNFGKYLNLVRENRSIIETFVNLFPLITTVSLLCYYKGYKKRKNILIIILVFLGVLINSIFVYKRMHTIEFLIVLIILGIKEGRIKIKKILYTGFFTVILSIIGELFRYGAIIAMKNNEAIFSINTIKEVIRYLMIVYLATDFNNVLMLLDSKPSYHFVTSWAPTIVRIVEKFVGELSTFKMAEKFQSDGGTVNIIGLWWYDCGIFTIILCIFFGVIIGCIYKNSYLEKNESTNIQLFYPIIVLGNLLMFRFNVFFKTIFLIPIFFIVVYLIGFRILFKKGE